MKRRTVKYEYAMRAARGVRWGGVGWGGPNPHLTLSSQPNKLCHQDQPAILMNYENFKAHLMIAQGTAGYMVVGGLINNG